MSRLRARHAALFFVAIGIVSLLLAAQLVGARRDHERRYVEQQQERAQEQAQDAAKSIDKLLRGVQDAGNRLLEQLNSGEVNSSNAGKATTALLQSQPTLWGVGITYDRRLPTAPADPNHYDTRPGGVIKAGKITYDYENPDEPKGHWWRRAMEVGSTWVPPYLGGTTKRMVAVYTGRFYGPEAPPGGGPAGAIIISMQLDTINRSVGWSELGSSGYGFVLSRSGSYSAHPSANQNGGFVAHPIKTYWRGADVPTFAEVAADNGNEAATAILDPSNPDPDRVFDYHDEITGEPAWLFTARIPTADWVLGFVAIKKVVLAGDRTAFHYNLGLFFAALNGIACLLIAFALIALRDTARIWAIVLVITLTPAVAIGVTWKLHKESSSDAPVRQIAQASNSEEFEVDGGLEQLSETIDEYLAYVSSVSGDLKPHTVLAGVFLQAIEPGQNTADGWRLSGTVWQRYANGVPDGEVPGFVFPDAVDTPEFEPFYDVQDGDTRTIAWNFTVSIQPERHLAAYPLDYMDLRLRVAHREVPRPIVLVPDVAEYDLIVPIARPGLSPGISPDDFEITGSEFGYSTSSINSTLGIPNFARQSGFPELTFTVHMTRKFLDPFISQMIQLVVIMLLLFTVHLMATRPAEFSLVISPKRMPKGMAARLWDHDEHPVTRSWDDGEVTEPAGGNYYVQATLTSVLALMFVTILAHNNLRSTIDATEIVYLDYAYFVLYVALLLVAVNSLLFGTGRGGRFVHWRKNLLPELLYWPGILTLLVAATLVVFY